MNYQGVIIAESLEDLSILNAIKIKSTKVERVTPHHKTPWLTIWTLHTIEIPEEKAEEFSKTISLTLDKNHPWYADYRNNKFHFIIFLNKVFKVDLTNPVLYKEAKKYGISLGIPEYQVDFVLKDKIWQR